MAKIMKKCFYLLLLLVLISCTTGDNIGIIDNPNADNSNRYIKLIAQNGYVFEPFLVNDSIIHVAVGKNVDLCSLKLELGRDYDGKDVLIDGGKYVKDSFLDLRTF